MAQQAGAVEVGKRGGAAFLRLRVKPSARRDRLVGAHGGALKLEVTAPPERGRANDAVVELLASAFGVRASEVEVTSGLASQDKQVRIGTLSAREACERLARHGSRP